MSPLDPQNAPFRCWEHEDCLDHPELALACADGSQVGLSMFEAGCNTYAGAWSGDGLGSGPSDGLFGSRLNGDGDGGGYYQWAWRGSWTGGKAEDFPYAVDFADVDFRVSGSFSYTEYETILIAAGML